MLVCAVFDYHRMANTSFANLLSDSALQLRASVKPELDSCNSFIDNNIVLVLDRDRIEYRNNATVINSSQVRRCGNFYHAKYFAERCLYVAMLESGCIRAVKNKMMQFYLEAGCSTAGLLPKFNVSWNSMLDDMMPSPMADKQKQTYKNILTI